MLPTQRRLGLNWSLKSDTFTFEIATEAKPFTRRGVLSTVNSIFDPLGFVAPVTIQGKSIMRELNNQNDDWDTPLPKEMEEKWIRKSSHPNQWKYVHTAENHADIATRSVTAAHLQDTSWLYGPKFLLNNPQTLHEENTHELVNPSSDAEVRPEVSTLNTTLMSKSLGAQRFSKFSTWKSSTRTIARLLHISRQFHTGSTTQTSSCKGWHYCSNAPTVEELLCAEKIIIKAVQQETYAQEYKSLETGNKLSRKSPLKGLDPFIDVDGLLRVGGRLTEAEIELDVRTPLIIPGKHHNTSGQTSPRESATPGTTLYRWCCASCWLLGSGWQEASLQCHSWMFNMQKTQKSASDSKNGWSSSRSCIHWSSIYKCRIRCFRSMARDGTKNQRWSCTKQKVGSNVHLSECKSCTHWAYWIIRYI